MNKVVELFGHSVAKSDMDWQTVVNGQQCVYANKKCYKIRKSDPDTSIGSCTVLYGRELEPVIICPVRLIDRRQIFTDYT
jgi:Restriction endonuclease NotI